MGCDLCLCWRPYQAGERPRTISGRHYWLSSLSFSIFSIYTTCNKIAYFSQTVTTFMKDIRIYPWNILLSWTYLYQAKMIPKSRYDSIDSFLSNCCNKWDGYNDIEVSYNMLLSSITKAFDKTLNTLLVQHTKIWSPKQLIIFWSPGALRPPNIRAAAKRGGGQVDGPARCASFHQVQFYLFILCECYNQQW